MQKFTKLTSVAAPLPIINIDTDMIIPKDYLKTIKRTGLGSGLFAEMRFAEDGLENADFVLNQPAYRKAEILVAGQHQSFTPEVQPYTGAYYYSVWLSLMDRPYKDISDLKGKSVAFSSRTSTSGYLIPSWDLIKKGLVPEGGSLKSFFGEDNIFYGTGYVTAVEQFLEGKAEAAAVSYYVYEKV